MKVYGLIREFNKDGTLIHLQGTQYWFIVKDKEENWQVGDRVQIEITAKPAKCGVVSIKLPNEE